MTSWDPGEPWFRECKRCGEPSLYGNRYCDDCYFEVSGGPDQDCAECGRQTEHPGHPCAQCRRGWADHQGDLWDLALQAEIEKDDR